MKPLLDSIANQQGVDFSEIGVIIVNDGYPESKLSDEFLKSYPFKIEYYLEEHRGVSGTRNSCLDHATADYICFCDADDMFFSMVGLNVMFVEMERGFNSFTTKFYEELKDKDTGKFWFKEHRQDRTFVHGKFHRRQYLIDYNIRFNDALTVHEDSYFNCLATTLAADQESIKCGDTPMYLWRWRDESVCRHDPLYLQKTYKCYIDSMDALVGNFLERKEYDGNADYIICSTMFDTYYLMNTVEWLKQENQNYRMETELRFKEFYLKYAERFYNVNEITRMQISNQVRGLKIQRGMVMEKLTFDQWIYYIKGLEGEATEEKQASKLNVDAVISSAIAAASETPKKKQTRKTKKFAKK